jgi:hypothetical protein
MTTFRGDKFSEPTVTLYRPTGPKELALIKKSKWKRFRSFGTDFSKEASTI